MLSSKYVRLVTSCMSLYEDIIVWIKLEGVEGSNLGIACIYAPNIPTEHRHMWHLMTYSMPRDCKWIFDGEFNMT